MNISGKPSCSFPVIVIFINKANAVKHKKPLTGFFENKKIPANLKGAKL